MRVSKRARLLAMLTAMSAFVPISNGAGIEWVGTGGGQWTTGFSWLGFSEPGAADTAFFVNGNPLTTITSINLSANRSISAWTIQGNAPIAGAYSFTRSNSAVLTLSGNFTLGSSTLTGTHTPTLSGFHVNSAGIKIAGSITPTFSGGSNVNTSGTCELTNTATLTVNGSTLGAAQANLFNSSTINIQSGGVATFAGTQITNSSLISVQSGGTLNATGNITILDSSILRLNAGSTFFQSSTRRVSASGATSKFEINRDFSTSPGATLRAVNGGDIVGTGYIDIGNGGSGTLELDGAGSTIITAGGTVSDWGRGSLGSFVASLTNSAQANVVNLNIGTNNSAASVQLLSAAALNVAGTFTLGGGSTTRFVGMDLNGGTLDVAGAATLDNFADINVLSNGVLTFRSAASINAGARIDMTGGSMNILNGSTLTVNGGVLNRTVAGELSGGATLRVQAGGTATFGSYFDMGNVTTSGALVVSGAGSTFSSVGGTTDWGRGAGHSANATIENGGSASVNDLRIASNGATATISVTGTNSLLNVKETLTLGASTTSGVATMTIAADGRLNIGDAAVELPPDGYSYINDTSANASNGGTLFVYGGSTLNNNGIGLVIGATFGRSGRVLVSGANSVINAGEFTYIGDSGKGVVDILAGGSFRAGGIQIGNSVGSLGVVTVDGANSSLRATTNLSLSGSTLSTAAGGGIVVGDNASGFLNDRLVISDNQPLGTGQGGKLTLINGSTLNHHSRALVGAFDNTSGEIYIAGVGSQLTIGQDLFIGNTALANALVTVDSGGKLKVVNEFNFFSNTARLVINAGGVFETNNSMLIRTRDNLALGYSGGDWLGTRGITSVDAQADARMGIGYVDDGTLLTVKLTLKGDTDLTGTVDFDDLLKVAQNYNLTNKFWQDGDFTYDGAVNFDDLLPLAQNYGLALSVSEISSLHDIAGSGFSADWALAQSMAPEPGTVAALLLACPLMRRRRASETN